MAFADYVTSLMNKLVELVGGDGGTGHVNVQRELPIMRASDPTTILTQFAPALVHAVTAANFKNVVRVGFTLPSPGKIPNTSYVDTDGSFNGDGGDILDINAGNGESSIDAAAYVAGSVLASEPMKWRRWNVAPTITYEPCTDATEDTSGGAGFLSFVRQAMVDWQACVDYAAAVLQQKNMDVQQKLDGGTVEAFYQLLGKLAADLDVMDENPPATPGIGEAFSYAKTKTEAAVVAIAEKGGEAAAELGNLAGKVAGGFGEGFFSQATFLTLAVAGIAVYVLLG